MGKKYNFRCIFQHALSIVVDTESTSFCLSDIAPGARDRRSREKEREGDAARRREWSFISRVAWIRIRRAEFNKRINTITRRMGPTGESCFLRRSLPPFLPLLEIATLRATLRPTQFFLPLISRRRRRE